MLPYGEIAEKFCITDTAYTGEGTLFNSRDWDGLDVFSGKKAAIAAITKANAGTGETNFRLRDWGVSRQRYWGCPIPIVHCEQCGAVPVPETDLPITLPEDVDFTSNGNPLESHPTWKYTKCPKCGGAGEREQDTFDTFFESSWYFLRYADPHFNDGVNGDAAAYWLPVDQYIGGVDMLFYIYFIPVFLLRPLTNWLFDLMNLFGLMTQGMVCHQTFQDENGQWLFPTEVIKQGKWIKQLMVDQLTPAALKTVNPSAM